MPNLLAILVQRKVLTAEQADKVRRSTKMTTGQAVEQAIISLGLASEIQIAQALAAHVGIAYMKINPLDLDLDVVTKALPGPFARKHGMVAISKSKDKITIAVFDPFTALPVDDIKRVTGLDVERVLATRSAEEMDPAAVPVVKALDHILSYAFEQRASDIHFEPKRDLTLVRLRIDGVLHDVHLIPRIVYQAVASRIKLLSGCNLAEKRRPQDGRIKRDQGGKEVELRVSTMPTVFGEKAVLRIFDPDILLKGVDDLGLAAHDLPKFYDFIGRSTGIILVTGPTGSGKTTTLYSVLKHLSKPEVNIVTIEDPIEMVYEDFNQVAVRPQIDVTFATALRTVLRQDPDIVMVGEIRDTETAEHAVQAALTGHLVLSTLHTNDAPSSITRLLDLDIPHFLITSTLIGILAQRLVRVNCKHCAEEYAPTPEEAAAMRIPLEKLAGHKFKRGKGCIHCRQTGYAGRDGIFEVMPITEKIAALITQKAGAPDLFKQARSEGLRTLREAAIEKVFQGITTVTEMVRVTGK
jgi:general secretion pathway protein E